MKEIIDDRGREVIYVRLHAVEPQFCDGENLSRVFVKVLQNILQRSPSPQRNALIRDCARRLELVSFCGHCWKPIDPLLRELVQTPMVLQ
jgi:hypothetical protein